MTDADGAAPDIDLATACRVGRAAPVTARGPQRFAVAVALLALLRALGGCAAPVSTVCRQCPLLVVGKRPPVPVGARIVIVIVHGLLGYSWEWNGAQIAFAGLPGGAVMVYEWDPWTSVRQGGAQLASSVQYLLHRLPRSVQKVVVIGHSAAGLLVVEAAAQLQVPARLQVEVLAVGSPLAGNYFNPLGGEDNVYTPLPLAMAGKFTRWPEPAPGVALSIWPAQSSDPVLKPHFGHDPTQPGVLPRAAVVHQPPRGMDHNAAVAWVARQLVAQLRESAQELSAKGAVPPEAAAHSGAPADPK